MSAPASLTFSVPGAGSSHCEKVNLAPVQKAELLAMLPCLQHPVEIVCMVLLHQ